MAAAGASDAVRSLAERARAQGIGITLNGDTVPLVTSVCRRLDGMPLAIELAAARRSVRATAFAVLGLACLSADLADWRRAAVLHGVAQAMRDQAGLRWEPFDARYRQQSLDLVSDALGAGELQRSYDEGMALDYDRAIELALSATFSP